mgnify:FL=1
MRIILGAKSQNRKIVLRRMGYDFEVMDPNIDEKSIRHKDAGHLTLALAVAKAEALLPKIKGEALLITSDQVVVYRGYIREKPETYGEAIRFLTSYNAYPAETVTSVVITNTRTKIKMSITDVARIYFNNIPEDVIREYVESGDAYNHAGGFAHEHELLLPYVKSIEGEPESIMGLPRTLTEMLLEDALQKTSHTL